MTGPTIAFIGAGSTVFAQALMGDILMTEALAEAEIRLHDIDADRLATSAAVGRRVAAAAGGGGRIVETTDRARALDGADYVVTMFQVGGYRPCTVTDFEVPKRFGLRQTIGDTLGIGGIMRAVRTIPAALDLAAEMERRCPDALMLQHVNPMAAVTMALARASRIRSVGLCHSVQRTLAEIAADLDVPAEEIDFDCAGINHMAFYTRLERDGVDLYPALRRVAEEGRVPPGNRVRYDLLGRVGHFVTESSEHFAEYVPWYIKRGRDDLIERFHVPLDEYPRRCERQIARWQGLRRDLEGGAAPIELRRSDEYAATIIEAAETGRPAVIHGNVPNEGLIDNLPADCAVEVPCLVDRSGVRPVRVGRLPPQLAALMQTNVNVHALTVEAALTGRREHVHHAAMLDPHTAAELDLDQIWRLVDELIEAHGEWIPEALRGDAAAPPRRVA